MQPVKHIFFLCCCILIFACQKQIELEPGTIPPPDNTKTIIGTWNFVNLRLQGTTNITTEEMGLPLEARTNFDLPTTDNSGTVVIDAANFVTRDISYSIQNTITTDIYLSGILVQSEPQDISIVQPPSSSTVPYTLVGTDSLHFNGDMIALPEELSSFTSIQTSGAKYHWSGDTLVMVSQFNDQFSQDLNGTNADILVSGKLTLKLLKP